MDRNSEGSSKKNQQLTPSLLSWPSFVRRSSVSAFPVLVVVSVDSRSVSPVAVAHGLDVDRGLGWWSLRVVVVKKQMQRTFCENVDIKSENRIVLWKENRGKLHFVPQPASLMPKLRIVIPNRDYLTPTITRAHLSQVAKVPLRSLSSPCAQ